MKYSEKYFNVILEAEKKRDQTYLDMMMSRAKGMDIRERMIYYKELSRILIEKKSILDD